MTTPIRAPTTIHRSQTYASLVDIPDEELDLFESVNRAYEEAAMRRQAEATERWINEYRTKMFRKVLNPKLKLKTEQ